MQFIKTHQLKFVILSCLLLFLFNIFFYFKKAKFDDTAFFGGDTWEYQSMAVNWAKGYGLKTGGIESYENYKFDNHYGNPQNAGIEGYKTWKTIGDNGGIQNFFRTPGYPFFLGLIYKVFGVHPLIAKQIQLILLIIIGSFLPLIGFNYWGKIGFLSGLISNFNFLNNYYQTIPNEILTESLINFSMFTIVICYILFEKKKNQIIALFFGSTMGISLLIKGSNVFIPLLFFVYFLSQIIYRKMKLILLIFFTIGILSVIVPWSVFATIKSNKLIFFSTQGDDVLLDGNNEFSIDGNWHTEGYSTKGNTYYHQPQIEKLPTILKLASFYKDYSEIIPKMMFNKLKVGFDSFIFLKISLLFIIYNFLVKFVNFLKNQKTKNTVTTLTTILLFSILFQNIFQPTLAYPFKTYFLKLFQAPVLIESIFIFYIFLFKKIQLEIPITFKILFANFLFITLAFFGLFRFTQVVDFVFVLLGVKYLLSTVIFIYSSIYNFFNKKLTAI
jgi:hypothetical protein